MLFRSAYCLFEVVDFRSVSHSLFFGLEQWMEAFKVGRLVRMNADKMEDINEGASGGLPTARSGHTGIPAGLP